MAFTTTVRNCMNRGLGLVGLKISTTRVDRVESLRLQGLVRRGHWNNPRFAAGLQLEDEKYFRFLREVCLPYRDEYSAWPRVPKQIPNCFYLDDVWFGAVDAEVLYSMIRSCRPGVIVEVGSGFSTRVIRRAISDGALSTLLRCIDPGPVLNVQEYAHEHLQRRVEELDASELAHSLGINDILFIDSSHTVTNGGDVPFLFLEVVPRLAPGVLIHVHDIFFPFDYPQDWVLDEGRKWNEQYLVQALLYGNNRLEIVWPSYCMWRYHRLELLQAIPSKPSRYVPSSLWLRKLA